MRYCLFFSLFFLIGCSAQQGVRKSYIISESPVKEVVVDNSSTE